MHKQPGASNHIKIQSGNDSTRQQGLMSVYVTVVAPAIHQILYTQKVVRRSLLYLANKTSSKFHKLGTKKYSYLSDTLDHLQEHTHVHASTWTYDYWDQRNFLQNSHHGLSTFLHH